MLVQLVYAWKSGARGENEHPYIGYFQILSTAVTTDDNISSYLTEPEITVHICVWPCASITCKLDFFSFLVLASDVKDTIQLDFIQFFN